VFVHGCFWHGHEGCKYFKVPSTRTDFWLEKINDNRARDERVRSLLDGQGWRTAVIWECATRHEPVDVIARVERWLLDGRPRLDISWQ
jgi:DNA mismatch endonuclease (patch repair protein)